MSEQLPAILMVLDSVFPSPGGGGAESQLRTLSLEFLRRGQPLEVLVPMVSDGPQHRHEMVEGISVSRVAYPKWPQVGAALMLLSLAFMLWWRRKRYDVIHAHIAGNMAAVCSVMGWLLGKPVLVKLTGMTELKGGILDPHPGIGARLRRRAMHAASAYQATSTRMAKELARAGFAPDKTLLLPNAVDTRRFASLESGPLREQLCGVRSLVAVFCGRLEPEKGVDVLIEAWARAFAGRTDTALMLVGSGSLEQELRQRARALGIESQLVWIGPSAEVERYLAIADLGVLPSQFEGLSNSLLEYMSAGLPVVGSRVSGTEDWVIDGSTGWLAQPGDIDSLARALSRAGALGPASVRALGEQARQRVHRLASVPAVVQSLQATYVRLLLGQPGGLPATEGGP